MFQAFSFVKTPHIVFGPGSFKTLVPELKKYNNTVLILTGNQSFMQSEYGTALQTNLASEKIDVVFETISKEPTPAMIDTICSTYASAHIDVVVGIGGGSVLDAGKAVSAMLKTRKPVKTYLEGVGTETPNGDKIPYIAVTTTSGTGSETTSNAVLTETGTDGFKKSLRHANYVPDIAIVDPELTLACPAGLTAATGMDAFTQLVESYLSTKSNPMTDSLALKAIKLLSEHIIPAVEDGSNIEARTAMSYASMISGITLANAGLGTVHGFASAIGGCIEVPHGVVCGTLMAVCNEYTIHKLRTSEPENSAIEKYVTLGKLFSGKGHESNAYYLYYVQNYFRELTDTLNIPKLGTFGLTENHFDTILAETGNKNNPVAFSKDELREILAVRV